MLLADRERRVNHAVLRHHANASAAFKGGEPFAVVFALVPVAFEGMAETFAPSASFDIANTPGLAMDAELVIDGEPWCVAGGVTPDASGWVTVRLSKGL